MMLVIKYEINNKKDLNIYQNIFKFMIIKNIKYFWDRFIIYIITFNFKYRKFKFLIKNLILFIHNTYFKINLFLIKNNI